MTKIVQKKIKKKEKTIEIPTKVLLEALKKQSTEPIEYWLLVSDPEFIAKMTQAKEDMLAGRGISLEEIKKNFGIQ